MNIEIYVCDNKQALVQTLGYLNGKADVLYTSIDDGETGDVLRYYVKPPRSQGKTFESFVGKLLIIARRG